MIRFEMHTLHRYSFNIVAFVPTKKRLIGILLAAFIFATLHTAFHNPFDHQHDASCSVYVLEGLFFSADIPIAVLLTTLFIPFYFIPFTRSSYCFVPIVQSAIRAPPHS
jgi:hypothetical protein